MPIRKILPASCPWPTSGQAAAPRPIRTSRRLIQCLAPQASGHGPDCPDSRSPASGGPRVCDDAQLTSRMVARPGLVVCAEAEARAGGDEARDGVLVSLHAVECDRRGAGRVIVASTLAYVCHHAIARM